MSAWLIGVVTVIYVLVALSFLREENTAMAIVFGGYALANIGLIIATMKPT
jgi:hypothetical protein